MGDYCYDPNVLSKNQYLSQMMNGKFGNVENVNIHVDTHTHIDTQQNVCCM